MCVCVCKHWSVRNEGHAHYCDHRESYLELKRKWVSLLRGGDATLLQHLKMIGSRLAMFALMFSVACTSVCAHLFLSHSFSLWNDGLIEKDVARTDRDSGFYGGEGNPRVIALRDVLMTHAILDPELGLYSAGDRSRMLMSFIPSCLTQPYMYVCMYVYVCLLPLVCIYVYMDRLYPRHERHSFSFAARFRRWSGCVLDFCLLHAAHGRMRVCLFVNLSLYIYIYIYIVGGGYIYYGIK